MANQLRRSGVFNLGSLGGDAAGVGGDADFDSVVLLLDGDGTNGQTTFTDKSNASPTIAVNGNPEVITSVKKFGTGSIDLDGTGDYLEVDFESNIGVSGDPSFTVECWVYFDTLNDDGVINLTQGGFGQGGNSLAIGYYTSQWRFYDDNTGTATGVTPGPSTGQWYHTAIVFDGTDLVFYIDGVARLTRSNHASNMPAGGYPTVIFGGYYGAGYELDGKIDDIRVTKGVARYTSSFTPPTSALSADVSDITGSDDVVLLLDGEGSSITDKSSTTTVTASGAAITTSEKKFGTGSIQFNGTLHQVTLDDPALGTDDFTIELWLKTDSSVRYASILSNEFNSNGQGFSWLINNASSTAGDMAVYGDDDAFGGSPLLVSSTGANIRGNVWNHLALVRNGTSLELFMNGSSVGTGTLTSGHSFTGDPTKAIDMYIGRSNQFSSPARNLIGYMDDFRITKGAALYPFHPPISALPTTGTVAGATKPTRKWGGLVGRSLIVSELPHSPNAAIFRGTTNQGSQALSINGTAPTFSGSDRSRYHTPLYTGYYSYSPATAATSWTAFYDWEMNATNYPYLASYGTTAGAVRRFYTQGTDIRVYRGTGATFPIMLSGLTDGQRYRAAFRWDGTNLKSYLISGTAQITALPTASATTTEDFDLDGNTHSIGVNSANNVAAEDLDSPLYAYAFYNSALTDAQMVDVFNVLNGHVI